MLAHVRFPVGQTLGRTYPEPEHPYRNAFQRDRDRVIHSRAFRRLEDKTQVFAPDLCDHFRNRLTHTIEVAQIARTLANVLQLDEDLTEALALAHDIGHPPFAHAGEEALDLQMRAFGERFEHNLHALRIVESFEQRYARFPGLNLTFELREGIIKHSKDFSPGEHAEAEAYFPGLRPPLEAQLIDLADEIAYNSADLDDAHSAGLLESEQVAEAVPQYREIHEAMEFQFPGATPRERFQEGLRHLIDVLVSGLIEGTADRVRQIGANGVQEVREAPVRLAGFTPEAARTSAGLKTFLYANVYSSPMLRQGRERSMEMIGDLFGLFLDDPKRLPEGYYARVEAEPPHRVICDYLAGMTDGFFRRTYEAMIGPAPTLPRL